MPSILGTMTLMNADSVAFICLMAHAKDNRPCREYSQLFPLIIFPTRRYCTALCRKIVCRLQGCRVT